MAVLSRVIATLSALVERVFASLFAAPSWDGWRAIWKVITGEELTNRHEIALVERWTARTYQRRHYREIWIFAGRRSGKSRTAALHAVHAVTCRTYSLAPGEVGVYMVIAADRRQARVIKRYVSGLLKASPVLAALIASETKETISVTNGLMIEIHTASFRTLRALFRYRRGVRRGGVLAGRR